MNKIKVRGGDIERLEPGQWLNDVIVDAYASLFAVDLRKSFVHN